MIGIYNFIQTNKKSSEFSLTARFSKGEQGENLMSYTVLTGCLLNNHSLMVGSKKVTYQQNIKLLKGQLL